LTYSQGILGTDIDDALARPDGITRDKHALQQRMRIRLDQRPVHERAGIPFVRVADKILLLTQSVSADSPFLEGGKARATAAPQTGVVDNADDILRRRGRISPDIHQQQVVIDLLRSIRTQFLSTMRTQAGIGRS
jgi:hypothetical protein